MFDSPLMKLAVLLGVTYVAWKYGPTEVKMAALGVAGVVVANQIPVVREGLNARAVA